MFSIIKNHFKITAFYRIYSKSSNILICKSQNVPLHRLDVFIYRTKSIFLKTINKCQIFLIKFHILDYKNVQFSGLGRVSGEKSEVLLQKFTFDEKIAVFLPVLHKTGTSGMSFRPEGI